MLVQDTWRPIQERFFEEAERAAETADNMPLAAANAMLGDSNHSTVAAKVTYSQVLMLCCDRVCFRQSAREFLLDDTRDARNVQQDTRA
eukprot:COSAG02_NODE_340_length_24179_cov_6.401644_19_plen_89_part_00